MYQTSGKNCLYLECDEIERLQIQPVDSIPGVHRNDLRTDEKKTKVNFLIFNSRH